MIGIYGIKNLTKNKWYVGQSIDIEKRIRSHFSDLRRVKHTSKKLQEDYNNGDTFVTVILEKCKTKELDKKEAYYMEKYNSMKDGYNFLVEDEEEYQVSEKFLDDNRLSWKAKGIYMLIAYGNLDKITIEEITKRSKDGIDSTRSGIYELVKYGYLRKKSTKNTTGKFSSVSSFKILNGGN